MYASEVWTLSKSDENALAVWERMILGLTQGPVHENCMWKIYTNQEWMDVYRETDVISEIRKERLKYL
jgi:hypothetical protein